MSTALIDSNNKDALTVTNKDKMLESSSNNNSDDSDDVEYDDDCQQIFPQRLMAILSNECNHDAISWLPHGRAFIIRNRTIFAEKIMPRFFPRKSKYSSFTRKLNRWNFVRVSSGPELGAYYHEFFLRDRPHLAAQMFCKNIRTKMAMASEMPPSKPSPAPTSLANHDGSIPPAFVPPRTVNSIKEADAATELFLRSQAMDPAVQFLWKQQLSQRPQPPRMLPALTPGHRQRHQGFHHNHSLRHPSHHSRMVHQNNHHNNIMMQPSMGINRVGGTDSDRSNTKLWQHIQAQKEQEAQLMQWRQLMAVNIQRQQEREKTPVKNVRASAA